MRLTHQCSCECTVSDFKEVDIQRKTRGWKTTIKDCVFICTCCLLVYATMSRTIGLYKASPAFLTLWLMIKVSSDIHSNLLSLFTSLFHIQCPHRVISHFFCSHLSIWCLRGLWHREKEKGKINISSSREWTEKGEKGDLKFSLKIYFQENKAVQCCATKNKVSFTYTNGCCCCLFLESWVV